MRQWTTITRTNGKRDENGLPVREHVWGWDVILPRAVSILGIAAALWAGIAWCNSITYQIAVARSEQLSAAANLPDKIAAAIAANDKSSPYVTRIEWNEHNADVAKALQEARAEDRRLLQYLVAGDRYNRRILSSLDIMKAKDAEEGR